MDHIRGRPAPRAAAAWRALTPLRPLRCVAARRAGQVRARGGASASTVPRGRRRPPRRQRRRSRRAEGGASTPTCVERRRRACRRRRPHLLSACEHGRQLGPRPGSRPLRTATDAPPLPRRRRRAAAHEPEQDVLPAAPCDGRLRSSGATHAQHNRRVLRYAARPVSARRQRVGRQQPLLLVGSVAACGSWGRRGTRRQGVCVVHDITRRLSAGCD
jgi:hypothetical protein